MRGGQVPIGEFFLGLLANESPIFGVDTQPFLATNYKNAKILWSVQKPYVEKLLRKQGLTILFSVPWPPQGLYTKKPVNDVDNLRGLKFRTYNPTLESFAKIIGAAPTQVQAPDIPQAFSTGQVEAMITSPSTGVNSKAWDFLTHYTDIKAWVPKNIVVVNTRALRRLDKKKRNAVLKAAKAAEKRGWKMSDKETSTKTKALKSNGIIVSEPSKKLMRQLREVGHRMYTDWVKTAMKSADAGENAAALIEEYNRRIR